MRYSALCASLLSLCAASSASAALLLDFGPTAPTGISLTNSPFHFVTGSTDTLWNVIGTGDVTSLLYSDGTPAIGLTLNLGASSAAAVTLIDLNNQPDSSLALGSSANQGVYADSSVGRDGIFEGTGTAVRSVGFELTGLAPGIYDVYVTTRNTNASTTNGEFSMTSFLSAGLPGNFDHSGAGFLSQTLTYPQDANSSSSEWVQEGEEGENYTKFTIIVEEGEALKLAVSGSADTQQTRGFLNSVAVVAVPEPSSTALLLGVAGFGMLRRWRSGE